jgi:hypothetical protein
MYLLTSTQPNLALRKSYLTQFISAPNTEYKVAGQPCLRYINGTWHVTLLYLYSGEIVIARI